jgi:hypothetical protein
VSAGKREGGEGEEAMFYQNSNGRNDSGKLVMARGIAPSVRFRMSQGVCGRIRDPLPRGFLFTSLSQRRSAVQPDPRDKWN